MKGILTIDNGNTTVKTAYFIGSRLMATNRFKRDDMAPLERFVSTYHPEGAIICSTASDKDTKPIEQLIEKRCPHLIQLTNETPMPIRLEYRTPHTLGRDRIATAVGAWSLSQGKCDAMVIDAGTAITYDLVTADGRFNGGNIAPGLALRFNALHEHTGRLPLVSPDGDLPVMGYDTDTAIRSGVLLGLIGEIKGCIARLSETHPNLSVFLTGGDAPKLFPHLQDMGINYQEHLAAEGLDRIYLYNQANGTI